MKLGDRVEYIDGSENTRVMWVVGVRTNDYVQLAPRHLAAILTPYSCKMAGRSEVLFTTGSAKRGSRLLLPKQPERFLCLRSW